MELVILVYGDRVLQENFVAVIEQGLFLNLNVLFCCREGNWQA